MTKITKEFLLNREELKALNEFVDKHEHSDLFFLDNEGASGIGQNTHIMCEKCCETEDITDYESW